MDGIHRWEWRTFAKSPAYSELLWVPRTGDSVVTRERYILSAASPNSVKIHDECLDIKMLVQVDGSGLEQWRPVMNASFPVKEAALDSAWLAWGLPAPIVTRRQCTLDEFLSEVVDDEPALCVADIEKKRTRLSIQGCPGEHVAIQVAGESWESIAFEHMDPFQVWRAVTAIGLENAKNTSYPAGLKRIVGVRAERHAIR